MKISEMIEALEETQSTTGDVELFVSVEGHYFEVQDVIIDAGSDEPVVLIGNTPAEDTVPPFDNSIKE